MSIVTLFQIDQFGAEVPQQTVLVAHVTYGHVAGHGEASLFILYHVEVAIELAA